MILNKILNLTITVLTLTLSLGSTYAQQTAKITPSGIGYLEYVPKGYNSNKNKYPVLISLHGISERGTTSKDANAIKSSVQKVANVGMAKYIKQGAQYSFIVISPQLKSSYGTWPASYVMDVVNHVKKTLRIDESRIYITGLSLGGFGVWTTISAHPDVFAAAIPVCSGGNSPSKACGIASEKLPIWAFHGDRDNVVSANVTIRMVNAVNGCNPKPSPLAKTTIFPGMGHSIWDRVYKETNALNWMLNYRTNGKTNTPSNVDPVSNAGGDKTITLPTNKVVITGSGSDKDGSVSSHSWSQVSGPSKATLANANTKTLTASNLKAGTYVFRLKVKDNKGAEDTDDVTVTVKNKPATSNPKPTTPSNPKPTTPTKNQAPIANAGSDKSVKLPTSTITLSGSGKDKDGKIVSYKWAKVGGPSASLSGATSSSVKVSGLKAGSYYFTLTVKDDKGASHSDKMLLKVTK
ncbi:PKD domain-containing protein [Chryseosolibacter indicus]|uniref:Prolyl oligopeptidase family serine peptidase n=1 Tax=Chryseosolibacter indicus TaxID=2782351 RepID=A0ABS5VSD2_9BACT|nr:PKD domain-containing protein [Chryseosolibacter indicus]MBT1703702.1 prolyl oligopeptidase family serine peptidase [Chryseosolibacter indicus]